MIIYKITNKTNGKSYIGQTTKELGSRIKEHFYDKSHIGYSLRKHKIQNFDISIIDIAKSREILNEKEEYWISYYDTVEPKGYNLTWGGEGGNWSEELKEKMRGDNNPAKRLEVRRKISDYWKGKRHPWNMGDLSATKRLEVKQKISFAMIGNKNGVGHTLSLGARKKDSERHLGNLNPTKRLEVREKISRSCKGKNTGDKNPAKRLEVREKLRKAWVKRKLNKIP